MTRKIETKTTRRVHALLLLASATMLNAQQPVNPYLLLMQQAGDHAAAHHAVKPALSPVDSSVLSGSVPVAELRKLGFKVIPWTTNDPGKMRAIIRIGVDGLISDRPDLLQKVLAEERASSPGQAAKLKTSTSPAIAVDEALGRRTRFQPSSQDSTT